MHLGHTAVLLVAPGADLGDEVEAELVLRQDDLTFRLRPIGFMVARASGGLALAHLQAQLDDARQGDDRPSLGVLLIGRATTVGARCLTAF
jgi:hypothetical protein